MDKLFRKELVLSASPVSYWFIAFSLMTFIPNYPILLGVFFITQGIFQSFRDIGATGDIVFSVLLPVAKADVVKAKYRFVVFIEMCGFALMTVFTLLRMSVLCSARLYASNALMNANLFYLGCALTGFGLFNAVFAGGFFKTSYKAGRPFVVYCIVFLLFVLAAESLHFFPGLQALNSPAFGDAGLQYTCLLAGALLYALMTVLSCRKAVKRFEKTDL